jgi:iron complex outermembrane receptor protein
VVLALLALTAPLASAPLAAQQPDSTRADSTRADSTVVPTYVLTGLTATVTRVTTTTGGASAVQLTLDSAAHLPAPTIEQVLRAMPLVQIRQNSRGEAQPALRGAEDRQIAVLMDGVPLTLGWDHRSDLSVIPLTAARSITMIRGLSSVLHGPNVLGGVVEVDVARGAARQERPRLALDASLDHLGGSALALTGGRLLDQGRSQWVVRGGVGYQDRPGVGVPRGVPAGQRAELLGDGEDLRLNSDVERVDGFLSARFLSERGQWLSLATSGYRTERGVPPEAHLEEPRLWRYPYQGRLVSALTAGTGLRTTPWGEGDLELSLGLDDARNEIDEYGTSAYRDVTGGEDSDDRTVTLRLLGDHTLGSRADLRTAFTWADVSHDEVLTGEAPASYRQRLWSAGSEVEWRMGGLSGASFGSTRVNLGVALDGADTPESGDKPPLGRLQDWGARLGASSATAGGGLVLHGGVSRRTRFPALRELYSGALGRFLPNPDLRPEVMTGGELGFTASSAGGELQLVGFHQRLDDAITRQTVETPSGSLFQRVNQGEIRSTGVELLASGRFGDLGLAGDLTLQRVRGRSPGGEPVELEYEPAWAGKLSAGLSLPWEVVSAADLRFRGQQSCQNPELERLEEISASTSLDLSLRRLLTLGSGRLLSRVEAVALVENLGDSWVFDQCGLPQPGRTLRIQLRLF